MIIAYPPPTMVTEDITHERVHEGRFFSGSYYNSSLANNGVIELVIQTHATEETHVNIGGSGNGDATVQFFTGTTFSNAGTAISMMNHNRPSSKVFAGTITHTPTLTADGTALDGTSFLAAGTHGRGAGEFGGLPQEIRLAVSTNYLVRITNVSGGAIKIAIHISGYQPTL